MAKQVIQDRYWDNALNRFVNVCRTVKPRGKRKAKLKVPQVSSCTHDLVGEADHKLACLAMSLRAQRLGN
jgi:hypothetical protein